MGRAGRRNGGIEKVGERGGGGGGGIHKKEEKDIDSGREG